MENSTEIVGELQQISPFLAENRPGMPYTVPAGYFNIFPENMLAIVQEPAFIADARTANAAFQVPAGYFESLAGNLLEKIRKQPVSGELGEFAILGSISRQNVYTVPTGYFERSIAVPQKQKAKLVTLARKWTQYAAAAVVAGILVTTAFLVTDNTREPEYKKVERLDLPGELDKMSENELVNYLVNPELPTPTSEAIADVRNNIHSLSDDELNQYLKENTESDLFIPASNN